MNVYLLVESGGEYSDRYHRNVIAFLTLEEAEDYIKEQKEGFALFHPYCFYDYDYTKLIPYYSRWEREILGKLYMDEIGTDFGILAGTPNRRSLIMNKKRELEAKRSVWARNEMQKDIDNALNDPSCPLSEDQKKLLIASNFRNPYENDMSDIEIEEIPVKEGSALWKMFNK